MARADWLPTGDTGKGNTGKVLQGSPAPNCTEEPLLREAGRWWAAAPRLAEAYIAPGPGVGSKSSSPR